LHIKLVASFPNGGTIINKTTLPDAGKEKPGTRSRVAGQVHP